MRNPSQLVHCGQWILSAKIDEQSLLPNNLQGLPGRVVETVVIPNLSRQRGQLSFRERLAIRTPDFKVLNGTTRELCRAHDIFEVNLVEVVHQEPAAREVKVHKFQQVARRAVKPRPAPS